MIEQVDREDRGRGEGARAPLFSLGRTVATPAALAALTAEDIETAIHRHVRGDWGNLSDHDREENEFSLKRGFRILSAYTGANGTKFWVITEADRSSTTVLLPSDY